MRKFDRQKQKKWDRHILIIAGIGVLLSGLRFLTYRDPGAGDLDPTRAVIGEIEAMDNDARLKNPWNYDWKKAQEHQAVQVGDSIYTGAHSQSVIRLKDGGRIHLAESTLITMVDAGGMKVPEIGQGNVVLDLKGKMKISIGGEIFEIDGNGAKLEISKGANAAPVFNVLQSSGSVNIEHGNRSFKLAHRQKSSFPLENPVVVGDSLVLKWKSVLPELLDPERHVVQVDRFDDFYQTQDGRIVARAERLVTSHEPIEVHWKAPKDATVFLQSSHDADFKWIAQQETLKTGRAFLSGATVGPNYWRLSLDHERWAQAAVVHVAAIPWGAKDLKARLERHEFFILKDSVKVRVGLPRDPAIASHLIEVARDPEFRDRAVTLSASKIWVGEFTEPGDYFVRVRSLNASNEISAASKTERFVVEKPEWPTAPRIARTDFEGTAGQPVRLSWMDAKGPSELTIKDAAGKLVSRQRVTRDFVDRVFDRPGVYQATLRGSDRWGRRSQDQRDFTVNIRPQTRLAKGEPPPLLRRPAQENGSISNKLNAFERDFLNMRYKDSIFQVEGAALAQYSSEEASRGNEVQSALALTLRSMTWFGANGIEASLKKAIFSPAAGGGTVDPLQLEAHYRRRWMLGFNPFSSFKESEFSGIVGYETYRNSGTARMASHYELMKVGFGLEFPLFSRMDTGGEVLLGQGFDASSKYEIAGHLHYYLRRDLSMGAGYRMHLFNAGSKASAPLGVPYREAYGEAYSTLRWHY